MPFEALEVGQKGPPVYKSFFSTRNLSFLTISRLVVVVVGIPTRPPECLLGSGRSHAADRRAVGLLSSEGSLRY